MNDAHGSGLARLALEASGAVVWDWHVSTGHLFRQGWRGLLGLPEDAPDDWDERVHPDDREPVLVARRAALEGPPEGFEIEYRVRAADGGFRVLVERGRVVERDQAGHARRAVGTLLDATRFREDASALRHSEERYRRLANLSPDGLLVYRDDRVEYANPAALRLLGASDPRQVVGRPVLDLVHPDYHATARERIRRMLEGGQPAPRMEQRYLRLDGQAVDVEVSAIAFTDPRGPAIQAIVRDVRLRKREERRLFEVHQRLLEQQALLATLTQSDVFLDPDRDRMLRSVTSAATHLLDVGQVGVWRFTEDRAVLRCLSEHHRDSGLHVSGELLPASEHPAYFAALEGGQPLVVEDARHDPRTRGFAGGAEDPQSIGSLMDAPIVVDGRLEGVLCCEHLGAARAFSGEARLFVVALSNILSLAFERDVRHRVERELRASETRLKRLVENLPAGAVYVEDDLLFLNRAAEALTGYDRSALPSVAAWVSALYPERPGGAAVWDGPAGPGGATVSRITRRDGAERLVEFSGWAEGRMAIWLLRDVTESARLARLMAQTERAGRIGGWEYDCGSRELFWTDETYRLCELEQGAGPLDAQQVVSQYRPESREQVRQAMGRAIRKGEPFELELELETGRGRSLWVRLIGSAQRREGRTVRVFGSVQDVTERRQAEETLRLSQAERDSFFQLSADLLAVGSLAGYFLRVNPAFERLLGYSQAELLSRPFLEFAHPDDQPRAVAAIEALRSGEDVTQFEARTLCKDGSWRWLAWSCPAPGPGSDRLYTVARDITRRKLVEEELELQARVLASMAEGVSLCDDEGFIRYSNPAEEAMFGYRPGELVGRHLGELCPEWGAFAEMLATLRARGEWQGEVHTRRRNGAPLVIFRRVSVLERGEVRYWACLHQDITERQWAEDEIRKLSNDLEQRVVERTAQLEAASEQIRHLNEELEDRVVRRTAELEVANRELESFSYSVSHDLRTPLRAIDGFSQALLEDYGDRLDAEGASHVARVRRATQRMSQIIDDLLVLAQVARGELRREPVDLSALALEIDAALRSAHPARRVEFEAQPGIVVNGDGRLLRVLLENLLGNAWKYTATRDPAHIAFGAVHWPGGRAFQVRDDGVGFEMAYADKLFGAFQRLHDAAEFPGSGIGLATAARIVRRHGGQIRGEGAPERGACFSFTLGEEA